MWCVVCALLCDSETGLQIKYVRIAENILDQAVEDQEKARQAGRGRGGGPGGRGGKSSVQHYRNADLVQDEVLLVAAVSIRMTDFMS